MRLRNVKGSRETISASEYTVNEPKEYKGKWKEFFGNDNPIHIEVGMGKGKFITTLASDNPGINYIGIEKYSSVLLRALEKMEELEISNICFIRMDAEEIGEVFDKDEVSKIYLNFSDPWPKDRHAKRRLTSRQFLGRYDSILKKDGVIFNIAMNVDSGVKSGEYTIDLSYNQSDTFNEKWQDVKLNTSSIKVSVKNSDSENPEDKPENNKNMFQKIADFFKRIIHFIKKIFSK